MSGKQALDLGIVISCAASIILSITYLEKRNALLMSGILTLAAISFFADIFREKQRVSRHGQGCISEIILLSEEDTEVSVWDIWGKASVIFGLSDRRNQVDVDLSETAYAGTVDREHAVMNFYNGDWFLEDLGSENGVYIKKERDEQKNRLSKVPCRVEQNDIIYLGMTKLKVR